jgi:uncharacterized membrane protein YedE/YeeE
LETPVFLVVSLILKLNTNGQDYGFGLGWESVLLVRHLPLIREFNDFLFAICGSLAVSQAFGLAAFTDISAYPIARFILGGLITGIGTTMANGCTSGHGICGISRLSPRSIAATATFFVTAIATSTLVN